jgi:Na+/H+-dicarboxylate symporter/ABC-type amino acid transport substrate-binding protein
MSVALPRARRRIGIASQVFIGLGLGVLVGLFFGERVAFLKLGGDAFIALLQITVLPYVVVALIGSLGRLTPGQAKALGLKAGTVLLVLWGICLVLVLLTPLAFPDWPSASFFSVSQVEAAKPVDFISLYIPANFFRALSDSIVPATVVFAILFGVALIGVARKQALLDLLDVVGATLISITAFVGRLAPYGVFAITASAAGTIDVSDLERLQVYLAIYIAMSLLLSFWVIPGLISALTPVSHGAILRAFRGPLVTAFATGSVLIVLPVLAADSKELLARTTPASGAAAETAASSVDILIPAAYPFPTLGGLLALMFVLFGGWYVGAEVSVADYPTLCVAGLASLFGGTVLALPFLFDLLRLPADLFQVFVTVDVIASRFGTLLAALHILAIALIGTYALQGRLSLRVLPMARFALVTVALTAGLLIAIRAFFTFVDVEPYTKGQLLANLHLLENPQPNTVYRKPPDNLPNAAAGADGFSDFRQRGVLRVCYVPSDYPSSYFNAAGELVGFDIEVAHRFARYFDVAIEFMPVGSIPDAANRISSGYCDVFMSLIPITPQRTTQFAMTAPVRNSPVGLIVRDHRRDRFRTWHGVDALDRLRIGILVDPSSQADLARLVPRAVEVPITTKADFEQILAQGAPDLDAIVMAAEEAAAWTIRYPAFTAVTPTPPRLLPFGYAVARGNNDMLLLLDTWLLNAKSDGTIDELYKYWMLGEIKRTQPPRWSVIRDVLGWD